MTEEGNMHPHACAEDPCEMMPSDGTAGWLLWLVSGVVLAAGGAQAVVDFESGNHVVDDQVRQLAYRRQEMVFIPYGSGEMEIPRYPILSTASPREGGAPRVAEGVFSLECFNVTDDGEVVLATGGPVPAARRIYVIDRRGRLVWKCSHEESWISSVDSDEKGRVWILAAAGVRWTIDAKGRLDERDGKDWKKTLPGPPWAAGYSRTCKRERVPLPSLTRDDFSLLGKPSTWVGRFPFLFNGAVFGRQHSRRIQAAFPDGAERLDKPALLGVDILPGPDCSLFLGKREHIQKMREGGRAEGVASFRLRGLAAKSRVVGGAMLGGSVAHGYLLSIGVQQEDDTSRHQVWWLKLDQRGNVVGKFMVPSEDGGVPGRMISDAKCDVLEFKREGAGIRLYRWEEAR